MPMTPEVLPLDAPQRGRRDLDGDGPAHPARQRHGPGAAGAPLDGRQQDGRQLGGVRQDVGDVAAPGDGGHRASKEGLGGAVERDHAAVEVQRDEPGDEGVQDVVGVALQVGQLGEPAAQLAVSGFERPPLLEERGALVVKLPGHVVERGGELHDLVRGGRLDALNQLAPGDCDGPGRELAHGARDPPGDQRGGEPRSGQDEHGQQHQLPSCGDDLGFHPPAREPHAGGAPPVGVDADRHREVVERLAVLAADLLREGGLRRQDAIEGAPGEEGPDQLGAVVVGRDAPVAIEDHGVGDVGLAAQARHVLLELRVVVEDERPGGHGREVARERVPALLDLADDGPSLARGSGRRPRAAPPTGNSRGRAPRMRARRVGRSSRSPHGRWPGRAPSRLEI
jgi:hypothetical protein